MIEDFTLPLTQENTKEILLAALRGKTKETAMTQEQLSQVVEFVGRALVTYGTAQAMLEGHLDVSINEDGQLIFTTTEEGNKYVKTLDR